MSALLFIKRSINLNETTKKLLGARHKVYHRTNKDEKKSIRDYDDGYYYRNGEEQYAQTLRNRQAEILRFDDIHYHLSRNRRKFNQTHIDFPNCTCAEDLKAYEKAKGKQPLPETASPVKDMYRLYSM
uniref:3-isopropylmalate dehydrogenase n=1 Tax=Zeugodacus cucurbitae TaxID=28588 RepID=A0A0A1XES7_ZEUCU